MNSEKLNSLYAVLSNEHFKNAKKLESEIDNTINEFSGLIDREGAIIAIASKKGVNTKQATNPDSKFVAKWKKFIRLIVDNKEFRSHLYTKSAINDKGWLPRFKVGLSKKAKKDIDGREFSEAPFTGYMLVLGNKKKVDYIEGNEYTITTFVLWKDIESKPKIYSSIFPSFMKELQSRNSYYKLFRVDYKGYTQSEQHTDRSFHDGKVMKIAQFNKTVQSTLVE